MKLLLLQFGGILGGTVLSLAQKGKTAARLGLRRSGADDEVGREGTVRAKGAQLLKALRLDDLILPGNGDAAGGELAVEGVVAGVNRHALHRAELLNVEDVLCVDGVRLRRKKKKEFSDK